MAGHKEEVVTEMMRLQGEESLDGMTRSSAVAMLSFRPQWAIQVGMSGKQSRDVGLDSRSGGVELVVPLGSPQHLKDSI